MKKTLIIILIIIALLVIGFALTFIPRPVASVDRDDVSKIVIFNGGTGEEVEVTDETDVQRITDNFNAVTFQKEKPSIGYMGYMFNLTFYNEDDKEMKELIVNSADTIRYRGFFYHAKDGEIDFEFLNSFFEEQ
ncbi:hypothetical protein BB776_00465 [Planococcus salinarum]|uniref:DUF3139 domain-containing protein n=1 Tax=Planococcus salinarum TaxID=622695 RepID=A0ABX3D0W5_9BACL|nr:hypothetical protein [Planococcus salinarum]OHX52522.1 hypothetical protein BB776_00465 [Planococcus salinarum]TAA72240.1 hypothetical protein D2909_07600 [Planococcus salinarum]